MASHIMCVTSNGGLPLFVRKKGNCDLLTFSKVASLNGIHMFLKNHDVKILSSENPNSKIMWKEFNNSVVLMAIANNSITTRVLKTFLDAIFNAMVLVVGLNEIEKPRSIEVLKKDLRTCYPVIDKLLECIDVDDRIGVKTDIINLTESIMAPDNHLLQICLDGFLNTLDSKYGCLLIHDCIAVASESWWQLDSIERKLLTLIVTAENSHTNKDIPLFLPQKSPSVAYRLVVIVLLNNVRLLALLGPTPDLADVDRQAAQYWKNSMEALRSSEQCYPRNFPASISLDPGILGFLLVNYKIHKFILSSNPQHAKSQISGSHRLDTIKTFYHKAVELFLLPEESQDSSGECAEKAEEVPKAKETFWRSEYHKYHALKEGNHVFCALYTSSVPTETMRLITRKTLKQLLAEKQVCW